MITCSFLNIKIGSNILAKFPTKSQILLSVIVHVHYLGKKGEGERWEKAVVEYKIQESIRISL